MRRVLPLCLVVIVGCSKEKSSFTSNFSTIQIVENTIVKAKTAEPYTGTLVARDQEITPVARAVLGKAFGYTEDIAPTGLVLEMPVEAGVPSGRVTVYVDLHAPKLHPEIARRSELALTAARAKSGEIKLAEATFKAGKLDGPAVVYAPGGKTTTKVAEAQFRDHVLHGKAVEYYPGTTRPRREYTFEGGVQAGPQRWFHANGKVEREATFVANEPDGEMKAFYATGAPREQGTYARGKLVGTHLTWFPNGKKRSELVVDGETMRETRWYSNGAEASAPPHGVIEEFHGTGAVHTRTTYAAGVKDGPYEVFYDDGKKWKLGTHVADQLHGAYKEWWKTGQLATEATYVNGVLDGEYKRWYANGTNWELARYARGRLVGPYRKWWKNGKPAHVYTYNDAGHLDGDYKLFYDSGAKWAVATYADGKPQGAIRRWFPDGKLGYEMNHANGRPDGAYKRWWPNGKPRLEANHVRGQLDGDFKNWLEDGTVYEIATYQRGVKTQTTRPPPP